jgi:hypothetical protein
MRYSGREVERGAQGRIPDDRGVIEEPMTTAELLEQWREATRAAELAERLTKMAASAVERTARDATASEELARLTARAATAAQEAAETARRAAHLAADLSRESMSDQATNDDTLSAARELEAEARKRYHEGETAARARIGAPNRPEPGPG